MKTEKKLEYEITTQIQTLIYVRKIAIEQKNKNISSNYSSKILLLHDILLKCGVGFLTELERQDLITNQPLGY